MWKVQVSNYSHGPMSQEQLEQFSADGWDLAHVVVWDDKQAWVWYFKRSLPVN